jgi:hypothetical protein
LIKANTALALAALSLMVACGRPTPAPNQDSRAATQEAAQENTSATSGPLFETVSGLDRAVFAAFNSCAEPAQLQKHAAYFAEDVEFYHDKGGVTWNRRDMLANTEKHVCGNFSRELVPGSLRVYPIKDFGAIAQGAHRFCQFKTATCDGAAEFVIIWRKTGDGWAISRVLSYGHGPA